MQNYNLKLKIGSNIQKNKNFHFPFSIFHSRRWRVGFSLIELLVVISIITILITVGMTSYTTVQKKGRDSKRKSDIKEIQNSLEQFYSVCGYNYPTPNGSFYQSIICTTPGVSIAVLPTVPTDPRQTTPYYCPTPVASNCIGTAYTICAKLESEANNTFCVTNQQ